MAPVITCVIVPLTFVAGMFYYFDNKCNQLQAELRKKDERINQLIIRADNRANLLSLVLKTASMAQGTANQIETELKKEIQ